MNSLRDVQRCSNPGRLLTIALSFVLALAGFALATGSVAGHSALMAPTPTTTSIYTYDTPANSSPRAARVLGSFDNSSLSETEHVGGAPVDLSCSGAAFVAAETAGSTLPEVTLDSGKFPESAAHASDAMGGNSADYTIDRAGAAARRAASMRGQPRIRGMDRDE
jgi:hypothetical protein